MIVKTLSTWEVADLLLADENANWSRTGCDFSEYENLFAFAQEYFSDTERMRSETGIDANDDDESEAEKIRDFIRDRGVLLEFTGGVIVSNF